MIVVGIDPGIHGAIAVIQNKEVLEIFDMPLLSMLKTTKTKSGKQKKKNELDIEELFITYRTLIKTWRPELIGIEQVFARPGQGVSSMFSFGRTMGITEAIIRTTGGVPIRYVTPQKWKKHHNLIKKGKDASVALCRLHYPSMTSTFMKSKDGRADAVLIAEYARVMILTGGW